MNPCLEEDAELLATFERCPQLAGLGISACLADRYGVWLAVRDRVVGMWSFYQGEYRYRTLANWEPAVRVGSLDHVVELTRLMARRRDWLTVPKAA